MHLPNNYKLIISSLLGVSLYNDLFKTHPEIKNNKMESETEFFTDKNYFKGLDW